MNHYLLVKVAQLVLVQADRVNQADHHLNKMPLQEKLLIKR